VSLFLFFAALAGGALNSVAGGGSFIGLPALLYAGVAPVAANATTTLAMWPGSLASAWAYRHELTRVGRRGLVIFGLTSLVGGFLGARLLLNTSDATFLRILPWLMLVAAVTFTLGPRLSKRLGGRDLYGQGPDRLALWALAPQLAMAAYGGYFGGGMGIMMLAVFSAAGMTHIHEMNALKAVLAVAINGVALAEFIMRDVVDWQHGLVMIAGAIVGGYAGAAFARRLDGRYVRWLVIALAWAMTIYFFVK
jgi:uncharacterized membrane protein YfcA